MTVRGWEEEEKENCCSMDIYRRSVFQDEKVPEICYTTVCILLTLLYDTLKSN